MPHHMTCSCGDLFHQRITLMARSLVCDSPIPSGPSLTEKATVFDGGPYRALAGSQALNSKNTVQADFSAVAQHSELVLTNLHLW